MKHLAGQYFLNSDLRKEELIEQAEKLCEAGYEIIYLHARAGLKTPYLSRNWFTALKTVTEVLKKHSVQFAIWDEDNFPSGVAGNRIVNRYPELRASFLAFTQIEAEPGKVCRKLLTPDGDLIRCFFLDEKGTLTDITEECGTLRDQWSSAYIQVSAYSPFSQIPLPHRRRAMSDRHRFAVEYTPACKGKIIAAEVLRTGGIHNTDLMNPETTKQFIQFTFDRYTEEWGPEELKKQCFGSFLDEPSLSGTFPWTRDFPEIFRQEYGYDLLDKLPHLVLDLDATGEKIRYDYRECMRKLLSEHYLIQLKRDLNARGLKSTGHLSRSEYLSYANMMWPDEMRFFKDLDVPCCDPLGGAIGKRGAMAHHIGIKAVSSAARLFGKEAAGADCFAVGGDTVTLKDLKFMLDYHLVMGITWYNVHGLYYTLEAERRDEAPPSLFCQHAQWPHAKEFLRYLKQRCEELNGEHLCSVELLYPSAMLESRRPDSPAPDPLLHETAELLVSRQQDFELIDEITLAEQNPKELAELRPFFVVAQTDVITESTEAFLKQYAKAGGKVILYGKVPRILGTKTASGLGEMTGDLLAELPPSSLTGAGSDDILIRQIRKNGKEKVYFFNRADREFRGCWNGKNIVIPPSGAGFAEELVPAEELPVLRPDSWSMTCKANCVPLRFWQYADGNIDLFVPRVTLPYRFEEAVLFHTTFFAEEGIVPELVTEEASLNAGEYALNGHPVTGWKKASFRDCRERSASLKDWMIPGKNRLEYRGTLPENAPYLTGAFAVEHPGGDTGFPCLKRWTMPFVFQNRLDLRAIGMATFSGTVLCEADFAVEKDGKYRLHLSELCDSGRLVADGAECGIRITSPAEWVMELKAGKHHLTLELCNGSGNRDIMSHRNAGITLQ